MSRWIFTVDSQHDVGILQKSRIMRAVRQTYRHARRNTSHPYRGDGAKGEVIIKVFVYLVRVAW